jgi:hypothetical protein
MPRRAAVRSSRPRTRLSQAVAQPPPRAVREPAEQCTEREHEQLVESDERSDHRTDEDRRVRRSSAARGASVSIAITMMARTTGWMPENAASTTLEVAEPHPRPRQRERDERSGDDERGPGGEDAAVALLHVPDVHRHLGRVRSRQQVRRGHQVEEVVAVDPSGAARRPPGPSSRCGRRARRTRRRRASGTAR